MQYSCKDGNCYQAYSNGLNTHGHAKLCLVNTTFINTIMQLFCALISIMHDSIFSNIVNTIGRGADNIKSYSLQSHPFVKITHYKNRL